MRRITALWLLTLVCLCTAVAQQINQSDDGFTIVDNSFNPNRAVDSLHASHKKIPKRMRVWTIDRFGDATPQVQDTAMHLVMNTVFTTGKYGEYNTTGNLGAPRIARIATDRNFSTRFAFMEPYSFFITQPTDLRFTNTLSPMTHLYYNSAGSKDNGEDHLKVLFASNINKEAGIGFKFNYLYGRGFYKNQSTSMFDYTFWGSYLGPRYQAHFIMTFLHLKESLNGGITNDEYVTHPETQSVSFDSDEIPTLLSNNWQRNDGFHLTLSHRYNVGFYRDVKMSDEEIEAKKFAMEAKKEQEQALAAEKGRGEKQEGRPKAAPVQSAFAGRPDDAKIMGDLPTDTVKVVAKTDSIATELADSLIAGTDSLAQDTMWMKKEYVPVTSFIHTMNIDNYERNYIAHNSPTTLYRNTYDVPPFGADGTKIFDETRLFSVRNMFGVALLEGLNKYIPMGAKVYLANDIRRYVLPTTSGTFHNTMETDVNVGAQVIKTTGDMLHYTATAEFGLVGKSVGDVMIDGKGDINVPLFKDTVTVNLKAFYHLNTPTFYQRRFHSKHFSWNHDDDFGKQMHTHIEGAVEYPKTKTALRVAYDNLQNYTYLAESYDRKGSANGTIVNFAADYRQTGKNISLLTIAIEQNAKAGILNWENRLTLQQSSDNDILPVPTLNYWTNLYLDFKIAKVLKVNFGVEMFWFTKYYAPEFCSQLGQYAVQENHAVRKKTGGYPFVNAYCNFKLKQCRFFVEMSHLNASMGNRNYFLTPHHPMNTSVLRLGLTWIFHN